MMVFIQCNVVTEMYCMQVEEYKVPLFQARIAKLVAYHEEM